MIDKNNLPTHVAVIMDGNGRWANKNNVPKMKGHEKGMYAMKKIIKKSHTLGVKYLTVYAFSTENWKRTEEEVTGLFSLLILFVKKELDELHRENVKVHIIGDISKFPNNVRKMLDKTLEKTKNNTGLNFVIGLNYGARDEIVTAINKIRESAVDETTIDNFKDYLYTKEIPDPDLIIRTSGEQRLSNFLLWQSAYSEFYFTNVLWPDFDEDEYEKAIIEYQKRQRRFGGR